MSEVDHRGETDKCPECLFVGRICGYKAWWSSEATRLVAECPKCRIHLAMFQIYGKSIWPWVRSDRREVERRDDTAVVIARMSELEKYK